MSFQIPKDLSGGSLTTQSLNSNTCINKLFLKKNALIGHCSSLALVATTGTLTAQQLISGCIRVSPSVDISLTTDTATNIINAINGSVGDYFDTVLDITVLPGSGIAAHTVVFIGGTGVTVAAAPPPNNFFNVSNGAAYIMRFYITGTSTIEGRLISLF